MSGETKTKQRLRRGIILLDVLVGVFILALIAAGVFSLIPTITRSQELADGQSKATQMANHLLEQLQQLKPSQLTASQLTAAGLIDNGQSAPPYSFKTVPLDEATGYSPNRVLKNVTAQFNIVDIDSGSKRIELLMVWRSASGQAVTYNSGTIIGGHR
jgi:Tfp pilus assembly protein PilV